MESLTAVELKRLLEYLPAKGVFRWKEHRRKLSVGSVAGSSATHGYIQIYIGGRQYMAHRLAWLYSYGKWPTDFVDHRNGVTSDNRLSNLREATRSQNGYNRPRNKATVSGFKGVYRVSNSSLYQSSCTVEGVQHYLGCFLTAEEASKAYVAFAAEHHKQFFNVSQPEGVSIVARPKSVILSPAEKKTIVAELKLKLKAAQAEGKLIIAGVKEADKAYALAGKLHITSLKASGKAAVVANKAIESLEAQLSALTAKVEVPA